MSDYEELVDRLTDAVAAYRKANRDRIAAALDAGHALLEAKATVQHGDFAALVERQGLHIRTAENWMRLAKAGLENETVSLFGGIKATLKNIREATEYERMREQLHMLKLEEAEVKSTIEPLRARCQELRAMLVEEHGEKHVREREAEFDRLMSIKNGLRAEVDDAMKKHGDLQREHRGAIKRIKELEAA